MGRPKSQQAPHVSVFSVNPPVAMERERTTRSQIWSSENTIRWGLEDNQPLLQLAAIDKSPTATSCLSTVENFIKGSAFSDKDLMGLVINKDGETLWELHSKLSQYMALLEGFSVHFTYDVGNRITNAYLIGTESCRFVNPLEGSKDITSIKYNPYFGTSEYQRSYTCEYDLFNLDTIKKGLNEKGNAYNGQVYFYGKTRPLYRFYPMAKYWSGKEWIYVDGQIQTFHKENLDNGFFQSVWMQVVGNPNAPSMNPEYQKIETGADGLKRKVHTKTQGQEFDERMSSMFSGAKKAGTAFVSWVAQASEAIQVQAFPVNSNFDILSGTLTDAIRGITIATEVPAILANLPQQASSLGSDGNAIKAAIDLMQSRVTDRQQTLKNFYNKILLPNLKVKTKAEVEIVNFVPVTSQVTVEDKFWEIVPEADKVKYVNKNVPGLEITEEPLPEPTIDPETGEEVAVKKPNENIKSLGLRDFDKIAGMKRRYLAGKVTEQDVVDLMLSYGYTREEVDEWLKTQQTEV